MLGSNPGDRSQFLSRNFQLEAATRAPRLKPPERSYGCLLRIKLTGHAVQKLRVLRRHGVNVTKQVVEYTLNHPERIVEGLGGRQIAERGLDEGHILRVVFIKEGEQMLVVTLYPARRKRY